MSTDAIRPSIRQRVDVIRSSDLPLQFQESGLLTLRAETTNMDESLYVQENVDFISDIMANRNIEAAALERLQQPDKAIALYEANLKDRFKGLLPYERLRVLYSSAGKYRDAIRVCQAYLEHGEDDEDRKTRFREWIAMFEHRHE